MTGPHGVRARQRLANELDRELSQWPDERSERLMLISKAFDRVNEGALDAARRVVREEANKVRGEERKLLRSVAARIEEMTRKTES